MSRLDSGGGGTTEESVTDEPVQEQPPEDDDLSQFRDREAPTADDTGGTTTTTAPTGGGGGGGGGQLTEGGDGETLSPRETEQKAKAETTTPGTASDGRLTAGAGDTGVTPTTAETIAAQQAAGSGIEDQGIPGEGTQGVETGEGRVGETAREAERDLLDQPSDPDDPDSPTYRELGLTTADVSVVRTDEGVRAAFNERGRSKLERRQARSLEGEFLRDLGLEDESLTRVEVAEDKLVVSLTQAGQRQLATRELAGQLEERFDIDFDEDDFRVVSGEDGFRAVLSGVAERRIQDERLSSLREGARRFTARGPEVSAADLSLEQSRFQRAVGRLQATGPQAQAGEVTTITEQRAFGGEAGPTRTTVEFEGEVVGGEAGRGAGARTFNPPELFGDFDILIGPRTEGGPPATRRPAEGEARRLEDILRGASRGFQTEVAEPVGEVARFSPAAIIERTGLLDSVEFLTGEGTVVEQGVQGTLIEFDREGFEESLAGRVSTGEVEFEAAAQEAVFGAPIESIEVEGETPTTSRLEVEFGQRTTEPGFFERVGVRGTRTTAGLLDPFRVGVAAKEAVELGGFVAGGVARDIGDAQFETAEVEAPGPGRGRTVTERRLQLPTTAERTGAVSRAGVAAASQAYEQFTTELRERPAETLAVGGITLVGTGLALGGAAAVSGRAGLAARAVVQPGEEALGFGGHAVTRRLAGRGAARRFFPDKEPLIFSEEAAIRRGRQAARFGRRAVTGRAGLTPLSRARFEFVRGQAPFAGTGRFRTEFVTEPEVAEFEGVASEPLGTGGRGSILAETQAEPPTLEAEGEAPAPGGGIKMRLTGTERGQVDPSAPLEAGQRLAREIRTRMRTEPGVTPLSEFDPSRSEVLGGGAAETARQEMVERQKAARRMLGGEFEAELEHERTSQRIRSEFAAEAEAERELEGEIERVDAEAALGLQDRQATDVRQDVPQRADLRLDQPLDLDFDQEFEFEFETEVEAEQERELEVEAEAEREIELEFDTELEFEQEVEPFFIERDRRRRDRPSRPVDLGSEFFEAPVATAAEVSGGRLEAEAGLGDFATERDALPSRN